MVDGERDHRRWFGVQDRAIDFRIKVSVGQMENQAQQAENTLHLCSLRHPESLALVTMPPYFTVSLDHAFCFLPLYGRTVTEFVSCIIVTGCGTPVVAHFLSWHLSCCLRALS